MIPANCGWLAKSSIDILLSNENVIMAAATKLDPQKIENIFNELVEKGVSDINELGNDAFDDGDPVKLDILGNFTELLHLCIDLKKKKLAEQPPQQQQHPPSDELEEQPSESSENVEGPLPKRYKNRR